MKDILKELWKYKKYVFIALIVVIGSPLAMDKFILGNDIPSNAKNGEWIGFFGSYFGAIIGSVVTLIGIRMTIKFTREQANEDRRLSIAPFLKFEMCESTILLPSEHNLRIVHEIDENPNTFVNRTMKIKNIGMAGLLGLRVKDISYNNKKIGYEINTENDVLEKESVWFALIDLRIKLDEIKKEILIKTPFGDYGPPPEYEKSGRLSFVIKYNDLLGNVYEQDIEIVMPIAFIIKDNGEKWEYTEPKLRIDKIGKSKIIKNT